MGGPIALCDERFPVSFWFRKAGEYRKNKYSYDHQEIATCTRLLYNCRGEWEQSGMHAGGQFLPYNSLAAVM